MVADFTALGGSAYAVSKTGTHDLKAGAVTGAKVKNHSIGAEDLKRINVRRASEDASADGSGDIIASCKRDEQLVGAAGGWKLIASGLQRDFDRAKRPIGAGVEPRIGQHGRSAGDMPGELDEVQVPRESACGLLASRN
jgi:hypothetical protein